jgi:Rrf2 family protein
MMLSLTKKVDYGLIALSFLAGRPGRTASASELARRFRLPQFLLANIMKELTTKGMVVSIRGVHGGYRLAREPETITLAEMIRALEDDDKASLADCVAADGSPRDDNCRISDTCPVKGPVRKVHDRLQALLRDVTLAELAEDDPVSGGDFGSGPDGPDPAIPLPVCGSREVRPPSDSEGSDTEGSDASETRATDGEPGTDRENAPHGEPAATT